MRKKKNYNFSYLKSGVNVKLGNELINDIKPLSNKTYKKDVVSSIGGFGAVYNFNSKLYKKPLLVSATDGVGTKILIAKEMNIYNSIGIDLVAMSVNDIIVQGARPLFFLDYIAVEKINKKIVVDILKGISNGCKKADCSLIGGETAELPGLYNNSNFDLAGFGVGVVEKKKLLPKKNIVPNDILVGLPSSGIHSNGYSLIRKIFSEKKLSYKKIFFNNYSFGKILLRPTLIYVKPLLQILENFEVKAVSHITGGGIADNLKRVLPENTGAEILLDKLDFEKKNSIFNWLNKNCMLKKNEMLKTFNCGIGMILVIRRKDLDNFYAFCKLIKEPIRIIGKINQSNKITFS